MADVFTIYERGIEELLNRLGKEHPRYVEVLDLQSQLLENIELMNKFGDTETRRAERARILDKLNKLAVELAGTGLLELGRGKIALPLESPKQRFLKLFPGLVPYNIEDADIFFGRNKETELLTAQIERDPIVIVNGLSGCGKSSLIRAGVIPRLQKAGFLVLYSVVYENVIDDILHTIKRTPGIREIPQDYVEAIQENWPDKDVVLIVDQFEQALSTSHDPKALERFVKGIPRLISDPCQRAKVVIVLRADWLYFLETSIRKFYPRLNVYSCVFTLDPLTKEAAREAIIKPLQAQDIPYEEEVVEEIVDCLQRSSIGPHIDSYVQPIQLQIVLRSLFSLAERKGTLQQALTRENYRQLGGVESILRNYLLNSLGNRAESWRLLARFIAPDGKTGRTIRRSELLAVPAAEDVEAELRFLISQGFIEVYEAEGGKTFYRLAHDYLVDAIVEYLNQNPDQQGWKLAEDWLANGTMEWRNSIQVTGGEGLLLERNRYLHIYNYRDKLKLTDESRKLLILTALHYGHEGLGYWLSRGADLESDVEIIADKLLSSKPEVRKAARNALAGCVKPSQKTITALGEEAKQILRERLWRAIKAPSNLTERDAAAQALWILETFNTLGERFQVGRIVFRRWFQDHLLQITSYLFTALLALALVLGVLYIREKLHGLWEPIYSLKAGMIPLVAVDPNDPEAVYVITMGGPGPREGCSLFVQQGNGWELRSRDFSKNWPTSLAVVSDANTTYLYATLYSKGIMRSKDGGRTWELSNRGLPSHGLTSIVADPNDPSILYLATDDWRGVLRSTDGGNSWKFYDYKGEIYGARITKLVYTRANGGVLIAGTWDGRILIHHRNSSDWELRFGLPKGAINALVVALSDERYVYAGTSRGIILRSQDGGRTWEVVGQVSNQFNITAMAVDPKDPKVLYAATYGNGGYTIWRSQDMGQDWEKMPDIGLPRVWINSLAMAGEKTHRLIVGTADGLFTFREEKEVWEKEPLAAPLAPIKVVALSEKHTAPIYAAVGGSIYSNLDGNLRQWVRGKGLLAEAVRTIVVDPEDPFTAYAGVFILGEWSIFVTHDGGKTWQRTTPPPIEPIVPDTTALAITKTPDGKTILYAGTIGCGVLRSTDGGKSWDTFGRSHCSQLAQNMPVDVSFLAIDANSPDEVYAATGQWFFRSIDGGTTWQYHKLNINSPIMGMVTDPIKPHTVYLITRSDGFLYSEDGGQIWEKRGKQWFKEAELTAIKAIPNREGHLIVGASNGEVWVTSDGGKTWRSIRENLAISSIASITTSKAWDGKILVGSTSDGMALFIPGKLFGSAH